MTLEIRIVLMGTFDSQEGFDDELNVLKETKWRIIDIKHLSPETSIGCSRKLKKALLELREYPNEPYERILWRLANLAKPKS